MRFGRNAQKLPEQSSGIWGKFFFGLIVLASLAVAYVLITPAEKLSTWLTKDRISLPWSNSKNSGEVLVPPAASTTDASTSEDNDTARKSVPVESLDFALPDLAPISIKNLSRLGSENYLFDPVKRSQRLALIHSTAAKDRAENLSAPNAAMNASIEKINRLIGNEQQSAKTDNASVTEKQSRLAQYRFHAESIMEKFNHQAEEIDEKVSQEISRRELIVRGLKEVQ